MYTSRHIMALTLGGIKLLRLSKRVYTFLRILYFYVHIFLSPRLLHELYPETDACSRKIFAKSSSTDSVNTSLSTSVHISKLYHPVWKFYFILFLLVNWHCVRARALFRQTVISYPSLSSTRIRNPYGKTFFYREIGFGYHVNSDFCFLLFRRESRAIESR